MNHHVLLINDFPGYGKVALSAMMPILASLGIQTFNLPTALVSNTLNYGKFEVLDTTDYLRGALDVWQELGFRFDAISTGFMLHERQARFVADYCTEQSKNGVKIFCDPIMGDNGKLYNSMTGDTVRVMQKLVSCADYITPNYTEALLLTGGDPQREPSEDDTPRLIDRLRELGAKSVVITSVCVEGSHQVCGYDYAAGRYFRVPYEHIPASLPGTGDIFSAIMMAGVLRGNTLEPSVKQAVDVLGQMIRQNLDTQDSFKGIAVESYLELLK